MTIITLKPPSDPKSNHLDETKASPNADQIVTDQASKEYASMTPEEQFERDVLKRDRQQNSRLSQRYNPGCRYDLPGQDATIIPMGHRRSNQGCIWIAKDRMRFVVILLGLIAIVLNQMSRVVVNITIPLMTYPVNSTSQRSGDSCPLPTPKDSGSSSEKCPNDTSGIRRFDWSPAEQDLLLGAFFYTYSAFQIPGGVLAERYGSKYIICASVTVSGLANLLTPWLARQELGLTLLFWTRIVVGIVQASVLPAVYALISQWITGTEAIVVASILKMAFRLGALLGSVVPGLVFGWEPSYYITGVLCMVWTLLWLFLVTSKPQDNSCVSFDELYRIARKKNNRNSILASIENHSKSSSKGQTIEKPKFMKNNSPSTCNDDGHDEENIENQGKKSMPSLRVWMLILTSKSVIGFCLCKLSVNFTTDFLTGIMPTYIRDLYHGDKEQISLINSLTSTVQVIVSFPISWLVKYTERTRPFGLKATGLRRLFTSVLCFGSALFLTLLTVVRCNLIYASVMLQFLAAINMLGGGGEALIPYDLSDEYPATIAALGNSFSSMSGFVIPKLKTAIIGKETDSVKAWNYYILAIAFLQAIGGFIFIFSVKAKKLRFSTNEPSDETGSDAEPKSPKELNCDNNKHQVGIKFQPKTETLKPPVNPNQVVQSNN